MTNRLELGRAALAIAVTTSACMPGQWVGNGSGGYGGGYSSGGRGVPARSSVPAEPPPAPNDAGSWDIWRLDPDEAAIDAAR